MNGHEESQYQVRMGNADVRVNLSTSHFCHVCLWLPRNWPITAEAYKYLFAPTWQAPSIHLTADSSPEARDLLYSQLFCQTSIKIHLNAVLETCYGGVCTRGLSKGQVSTAGCRSSCYSQNAAFSLWDYWIDDELRCAPAGKITGLVPSENNVLAFVFLCSGMYLFSFQFTQWKL